MTRYDERNTIFARMAYEEGTYKYEDYYKKHPEKEAEDNRLRNKPELLGEGTATYHPLIGPIADANFGFIQDIRYLVEGKIGQVKQPCKPDYMTKLLKGLTLHYGACKVGIAKMDEEMYYSHRGRFNEYGKCIDGIHPYGIVFAIEMKQEMVNRAPQLASIIESSNAYITGAIIGMQLSYYIRQLGYDARNHMDSNYLVVAPLVAEAAGLGEIGRSGIIVTREYGARVRLGVVTTELPLIPDQPIDFGLEEFCKACGKCARTCPAKAISKSNNKEDWKINHEQCYDRWRSLGTDCGICLSNCPFSQGVDQKDDIQTALNKYEEKYPIRPYIKEKPEWFE